MQDKLIHVSEQAWGDEKPRAALIHVTLTGDKLFSGRAAFEKAVELRRLVTALAERDFPDSVVALSGATLDVSTGLFTRSSSVTYRVRIRVDALERLADALDVIAALKQARLTHIEWDYATSASDELIAQCASRALAKAKTLAAALGVTIAGVHSVHEEVLADTPPYPPSPPGMMYAMGTVKARKGIADEIEGLDLAPTKRIGVTVKIACTITP